MEASTRLSTPGNLDRYYRRQAEMRPRDGLCSEIRTEPKGVSPRMGPVPLGESDQLVTEASKLGFEPRRRLS